MAYSAIINSITGRPRFQRKMIENENVIKLDSVEPTQTSQNPVDKKKIVTNLVTGERFLVKGGLTWKWIAENVCNGVTSPKMLYNVAVGKSKATKGWTVELVEE